MIFLELLSSVGLTFMLGQTDGPFNLFLYFRSWLFRNKYFGVFFYKLFDCNFCLGMHCGWIMYLINKHFSNLNFFDLITFSLASAFTSLLSVYILNKLAN